MAVPIAWCEAAVWLVVGKTQETTHHMGSMESFGMKDSSATEIIRSPVVKNRD
jgi:hypothetical protein